MARELARPGEYLAAGKSQGRMAGEHLAARAEPEGGVRAIMGQSSTRQGKKDQSPQHANLGTGAGQRGRIQEGGERLGRRAGRAHGGTAGAGGQTAGRFAKRGRTQEVACMLGMGRQESKQSFGTASREVRDASVDRRGGSSGQGRTQEQEPKMRRVRERGLEWRDGRRQSKKPTDKLLAPNRSCRSDRQLAEDGTQG